MTFLVFKNLSRVYLVSNNCVNMKNKFKRFWFEVRVSQVDLEKNKTSYLRKVRKNYVFHLIHWSNFLITACPIFDQKVLKKFSEGQKWPLWLTYLIRRELLFYD